MPKTTKSRTIRETTLPILELEPHLTLSELDVSSLGGAGGAPSNWKRLNCAIPKQEQTNWCWCATTLGVHKYFNASDATTQCQAANKILARVDACSSPSSTEVNIPYYLDRALSSFGHLRAPTIGNALSFDQVKAEITSSTPLGTRIGWAGGGGHFMVIAGVFPGPVPRLAVHDPIYGQIDIDYALYLSAYQGSGTWTHAYLTKNV